MNTEILLLWPSPPCIEAAIGGGVHSADSTGICALRALAIASFAAGVLEYAASHIRTSADGTAGGACGRSAQSPSCETPRQSPSLGRRCTEDAPCPASHSPPQPAPYAMPQHQISKGATAKRGTQRRLDVVH
eukprot:2757405-Prymnesium_polylepis.1